MAFMGVKTIYNHADFRLMSKRAVEQFSKFKETNMFLRGMVPLIGYQSDSVYYDRKERVAGESKYPLKKMLALAFNGISSFSVKPISMIMGLGMVIGVDPADAQKAMDAIEAAGEKAYIVGQVEAGEKGVTLC